MELVKDDAINSLRAVLGPTNSLEAKKDAPYSLRAAFGSDAMRNGIHGSADESNFNKESNLYFSKQFGPTAAFNNCTCCIIKPHAVQEGTAGQIIDMIL